MRSKRKVVEKAMKLVEETCCTVDQACAKFKVSKSSYYKHRPNILGHSTDKTPEAFTKGGWELFVTTKGIFLQKPKEDLSVHFRADEVVFTDLHGTLKARYSVFTKEMKTVFK